MAPWKRVSSRVPAEGVAAVDAPGDALGDGQGVEAGGGHVGFGVLVVRKVSRKPWRPCGPLRPSLGGDDRATGDTGDEADVVEKAVRGAGVCGLEFLEHSIGEGGGAHPAAGEGEADVEVVCWRDSRVGEGGVLALQGLVLRLVPGGAAEEEQEGEEGAAHQGSGSGSVRLLQPWPADFKGETLWRWAGSVRRAPWRAAMARTRARPRPWPLVARSRSARVKRSKASGLQGVGEAGAGVGDAHQDAVGFGGEGEGQVVAGGAVFDGVVEEVGEDLGDEVAVAEDV